MSTSGEEVQRFDEASLVQRLQHLKNLPDERKPEAITVSLINSFANAAHEVRLTILFVPSSVIAEILGCIVAGGGVRRAKTRVPGAACFAFFAGFA